MILSIPIMTMKDPMSAVEILRTKSLTSSKQKKPMEALMKKMVYFIQLGHVIGVIISKVAAIPRAAPIILTRNLLMF
jgi:hypothetical protein